MCVYFAIFWQNWYHASLSRAETESVLHDTPVGTYLVRPGTRFMAGDRSSLWFGTARKIVAGWKFETLCTCIPTLILTDRAK
jgi:hypothetical protein